MTSAAAPPDRLDKSDRPGQVAWITWGNFYESAISEIMPAELFSI